MGRNYYTKFYRVRVRVLLPLFVPASCIAHPPTYEISSFLRYLFYCHIFSVRLALLHSVQHARYVSLVVIIVVYENMPILSSALIDSVAGKF